MAEAVAGGRPQSPRRPLRLVSLLVAAVPVVAVAFGLWGFSYDDAFITYRYADNWSHGEGMVFNSGEAVLGTTAPGWALVLGAAAGLSRALGLDALGVPQWGTLLSLLSLWWLTAGLPTLWLPPRLPYLPLFPWIFTLSAGSCRWLLELLGAELFPASALAATAVWAALVRRRPVVAGALAGAAMVCRLDAALAAGLIAGALCWRHRRLPLRFVAAATATAGPFLLWLVVAFGTVLPNTLAGKRSEATGGMVDYARWELSWLSRSLDGSPATWWLAALALVGAVLLWRSAGATASPRGGLALATLAGWVALHEGFYHLAVVPFAPWYHVAPLLAALGLASWGIVALAVRVPRAGVVTWTAAIMLAVPLALPGVRFLAGTWGEPPDIRTRLYRQVAEHLRATAEPEDSIASMEIGALAYYSDRPVLDLIGLVDPGVVAARNSGRLPELVADRSPRFILVPPPFLGRELEDVMQHPEIARRYRPAFRFFDPGYEHDPVALYQRID